jgi:3-deoxy-manno-octulosonate cytidylyltransferase (CMP-KDO synthetase)
VIVSNFKENLVINNSQKIVIPARMTGTRLPGKPLIDIAGKPMLLWVWEQCELVMDKTDIFVATEDKVIEEFCFSHKINCVNTGPALTAIDRIKLFSDLIPAKSYINVQGDEPIVNPLDIKTIMTYTTNFPNRVVFGKCSASKAVFFDHTKAKVICRSDGKLLYSSRAPIPMSTDGGFRSSEKAVWIYGFYKEALDLYYNGFDKAPIEKIEGNEIIRFLELGVDVFCTDVIGDSWAVDVKNDIKIVEEIMNSKNQ